MSNRLHWLAIYLIVFLIIALGILLVVYYMEPGSAYHGMNWVWEIF